jgi:hypothetical protein
MASVSAYGVTNATPVSPHGQTEPRATPGNCEEIGRIGDRAQWKHSLTVHAAAIRPLPVAQIDTQDVLGGPGATMEEVS